MNCPVLLILHPVLKLVFDVLKMDNLLVSESHLCQNFIEVNVLENLKVLHLIFQLADLFLFATLVSLQAHLFIVELLQLDVETFDKFLVVSQIALSQL